MLVLSRQRDQEIVIGDDIVVTVIEVRGDKVRLGIKAPLHIPVHRNEVYELIQRKAAAANSENLTNSMPEASAEG
jgi:carbon storage regulator